MGGDDGVSEAREEKGARGLANNAWDVIKPVLVEIWEFLDGLVFIFIRPFYQKAFALVCNILYIFGLYEPERVPRPVPPAMAGLIEKLGSETDAQKAAAARAVGAVIGENPKSHEAFARAGAAAPLVALLASSADGVVSEAAGAIAALASQSPGAKAVGRAGGVAALQGVLKGKAGGAQGKERAAASLRMLVARCAESRKDLSEKGRIEALAEAMMFMEPAAQEHIAHVLCAAEWAGPLGTEAWSGLVSAGGLEVLVAAMVVHERPGLHIAAARVLSCALRCDPSAAEGRLSPRECLKRIDQAREAGVCKAVVGVLSTAKSAKVDAAEALACLSQSRAAQPALLDAGMAPVVLQQLDVAGPAKLQRTLARCASALLSDPTRVPATAKAFGSGLAPALLRVLRGGDPEASLHAAAALAGLAGDPKGAGAVAGAAGAVEDVVRALASKEPALVAAAAGVLAELAASGQAGAVADGGAVPRLVEMLAGSSGGGGGDKAPPGPVREQAAWVLWGVAQESYQAREEAGRAGAVAPLVAMLSSQHGRGDEVAAAVGALWALTAACAPNASSARDAGAVPALLRLLARAGGGAREEGEGEGDPDGEGEEGVDPGTAEHAAATLANITAEVVPAGRAVLAEGGARALVAAAARGPRAVRIQALAALGNVCSAAAAGGTGGGDGEEEDRGQVAEALMADGGAGLQVIKEALGEGRGSGPGKAAHVLASAGEAGGDAGPRLRDALAAGEKEGAEGVACGVLSALTVAAGPWAGEDPGDAKKKNKQPSTAPSAASSGEEAGAEFGESAAAAAAAVGRLAAAGGAVASALARAGACGALAGLSAAAAGGVRGWGAAPSRWAAAEAAVLALGQLGARGEVADAEAAAAGRALAQVASGDEDVVPMEVREAARLAASQIEK